MKTSEQSKQPTAAVNLPPEVDVVVETIKTIEPAQLQVVKEMESSMKDDKRPDESANSGQNSSKRDNTANTSLLVAPQETRRKQSHVKAELDKNENVKATT